LKNMKTSLIQTRLEFKPFKKSVEELDTVMVPFHAGMERLNREGSQGVDIWQDLAGTWSNATVEGEELGRLSADLDKKFKDLKDSSDAVGQAGASAFEDYVFGAKSASEAIKALTLDIAKMVFQKQVSKPLAGAISSGIDSIDFGGFFVGGGRPPANRPSVVGEDGPELFIPDSAGTVISNSKAFGSGSPMASNSNTMTVQVIDQRAASAPAVEQQRGRGPDGDQFVRIIIRDEVSKGFNDGGFDRDLRTNHGVNRVGGVG